MSAISGDQESQKGSASTKPPRVIGQGQFRVTSEMPGRLYQAAAGDVMEGAPATYIHGDQATEEVADDARNGIKEMVLFEVLPATAEAIRWSKPQLTDHSES